MKSFRGRGASFIAALTVTVLCGCELLVNSKKEITRRSDELRVLMHQRKWKEVSARLTKDFSWTASNGRKVSKNAKKYYCMSIDKVPERRQFHVTIQSLKRITDAKYIATAVCRLQVNAGAASTDNVTWTTRQTWVKQQGQWLLAAVEDQEAKKGSRGRSYDTDPPPPRGKAAKPRSSSRSSRRRSSAGRSAARATGGSIGSDVGSFADYATGYTPLKVKQKSRSRIDKLQQKQNERTRRALE